MILQDMLTDALGREVSAHNTADRLHAKNGLKTRGLELLSRREEYATAEGRRRFNKLQLKHSKVALGCPQGL